jgi:hypothetical protein
MWVSACVAYERLSFVFLAACDFNGREIPDWKPVLALADTAQDRGEVYYAKSLYLQVRRLAASRDDWAGLLAAACGIKNRTGEEVVIQQRICFFSVRR